MCDKENELIKFQYMKSLKSKGPLFINKIIKVEAFFHRPLASLIVRMVFKTKITPNQISYASFFLGILAMYFFTLGNKLFVALGGGFTLISSIVDCADGQLARAKNMCSNFGAYLDVFFDRIVDFGIIVSIALGTYRVKADITLLIIGISTAGLYLLQVILFYLKKQYLENSQTGDTSEAHSLLLLAIGVFGFINRMDIFLYIFFAETVIANVIRIIDFMWLGTKQKN